MLSTKCIMTYYYSYISVNLAIKVWSYITCKFIIKGKYNDYQYHIFYLIIILKKIPNFILKQWKKGVKGRFKSDSPNLDEINKDINDRINGN